MSLKSFLKHAQAIQNSKPLTLKRVHTGFTVKKEHTLKLFKDSNNIVKSYSFDCHKTKKEDRSNGMLKLCDGPDCKWCGPDSPSASVKALAIPCLYTGAMQRSYATDSPFMFVVPNWSIHLHKWITALESNPDIIVWDHTKLDCVCEHNNPRSTAEYNAVKPIATFFIDNTPNCEVV